MTSLLEQKLKQSIAKGFNGRLTYGVLRRTTTTGLDSYGDATTPTTQDVEFQGIRQNFTAYYKATFNIPETDVKILLLLGSMNPEIVPKQDDLIYMKKPWLKWFKCRQVIEIDPAGASCLVQAYELPVNQIAAP